MKDNVSGKNVTIVSVCLITLLTLMGCGNSPFEKNNLPKENVEFPSTYEKEIERVKFHTQLVIPEDFNQDMLMQTTARKRIPDMDKVKKHFEEKIQGQTVKEKFDDPPEKKGLRLITIF